MENLTTPRIIVTGDYPNSPFKVGEILTHYVTSIGYVFIDKHGVESVHSDAVDKYPHLFRRLNWWEFREIGDMPEYLKDGDGVIYRHFKYSKNDFGDIIVRDTLPEYERNYSLTVLWRFKHLLPATIQDYTDFQTSQTTQHAKIK